MNNQEKNEQMVEARKAWHEKLEKALDKHPERKSFKLESELELKSVYDELYL